MERFLIGDKVWVFGVEVVGDMENERMGLGGDGRKRLESGGCEGVEVGVCVVGVDENMIM